MNKTTSSLSTGLQPHYRLNYTDGTHEEAVCDAVGCGAGRECEVSTSDCYNEIVLDPAGNTYVGSLAQQFLFGKLKLPTVFKLDPDDMFHVFEVMDSGEVIHRASQSTRRLAQGYMSPERICVYHRYPELRKAVTA